MNRNLLLILLCFFLLVMLAGCGVSDAQIKKDYVEYAKGVNGFVSDAFANDKTRENWQAGRMNEDEISNIAAHYRSLLNDLKSYVTKERKLTDKYEPKSADLMQAKRNIKSFSDEAEKFIGAELDSAEALRAPGSWDFVNNKPGSTNLVQQFEALSNILNARSAYSEAGKRLEDTLGISLGSSIIR